MERRGALSKGGALLAWVSLGLSIGYVVFIWMVVTGLLA
ncbi:MAG: hypothetical protein ACJAZ8_000726 [Planctomycetota bacterium]|jgi:hypothetical protein